VCRRHCRGADRHIARSLNDPDVLANGYVTDVDYLKRQAAEKSAARRRISRNPARSGIAPELGADNDDVLSELG